MKFALLSDIHLEFAPAKINNTQNADVLLLAGDICIASAMSNINSLYYREFMQFFDDVSKKFKEVYMVMGNHEHYKGDFKSSYYKLSYALSSFANIHLLEKEVVELSNEISLIGATLFTDFKGGDPLVMYDASCIMNDYKQIKDKSHPSFKLLPQTLKNDHDIAKKFIFDEVSKEPNKKFVVMTHHAPSFESIDLVHRGSPYNPMYASELSYEILEYGNIAAFVHGHVHSPSEYEIGNTKVYCNPRGYADSFEELEPLYFDV